MPGALARVVRLLVLGAALTIVATCRAEPPVASGYRLDAREVAPGTFVFVGTTEDFSPQNGGNIVNTAFVVTADGVVVIDTGSTRGHGEAIRQAIASRTPLPIREVWITHHHPDHFLGNQAFAGLPIAALAATAAGLREEGPSFATNVYRMTGDWAKGTEVTNATTTLTAGIREIGGHRFRLLALAGHTGADLAILDETTGVLFTGDLTFRDRAPTTPHADIARWLESLDRLAELPFRVLVPGHGPPSGEPVAIRQTRAWLTWLEATLRASAAAGLDPAEILEQPMPAPLAALALARQELVRSIAHLYRGMESAVLAPPPAAAAQQGR